MSLSQIAHGFSVNHLSSSRHQLASSQQLSGL